MSHISSAGIARGAPGYGKTCRQDILRRVHIPVVPGAAGRARPVPDGQTQFREQVPARRAGLRTRIPAVDYNQFAPVAFALVLKLAAELAPAAGADRAGQLPVAHHPGHVQVFDYDHVVLADEAGAGTVQEIGPRVADLAMGAGDFGRGLGPVGRSFPAAGRAPLVAGQPASLALQVARVGDLFPPDVTAKCFTPRSTPATRPVPGSGSGSAASTVKVTYQRPSGSREMITSAGSSPATSVSGQVHAYRRCPSVFASRSTPPRIENADRV